MNALNPEPGCRSVIRCALLAAAAPALAADDGPVSAQLKSRMPDLTVLAHGPREMPIWGRAFQLQSSAFFENYPPKDHRSAVRSRILALTEYVYRLQQK